MSINSIFDISKKSLLANQQAISSTAKNISNVSTEGYKRRVFEISKYTSGLGFATLNGKIDNEGVMRMRNRFIENQLWYENQFVGQYSSDEAYMSRIEDIFGEPQEFGLSNMMSEYWDSWNDLANSPESQTARQNVKNTGVRMADTFNRVYNNLKKMKNDIRTDIQGEIKYVNSLLDQLGKINVQIHTSPANDLLDQRDLLVTEISSMIAMDIRENFDSTITMSSGGHIIITGSTVDNLEQVSTVNSEGITTVDIRLIDSNQSLSIKTGKLGSMATIHNTNITNYIRDLNEVAVALSSMVNQLHSNGYSLDGTTGVNFFDVDTSSAGNIVVNQAILSDPSKIATAAGANTSGDGSVALAISDLQFNKTMSGDTSLSEFYNILVSDIGQDVNQANFFKENQEKIIQSLENKRDASSAVSIDEEMTKLIEYEQAYQAAAKVINVVNDLAITLINLGL